MIPFHNSSFSLLPSLGPLQALNPSQLDTWSESNHADIRDGEWDMPRIRFAAEFEMN